jgi:hypothetical protein
VDRENGIPDPVLNPVPDPIQKLGRVKKHIKGIVAGDFPN